jgi:hypothetical protein
VSDEYTPEEVNQVQNERALFQRVLLSDSDGNNVMAWIGNYCGAWAQDPAIIKPELIAFWNSLLGMCGIVHPQNLEEIAEKLSQAANNSDLAKIRERFKQSEGGANGQA